jgi:hypothetical protein
VEISEAIGELERLEPAARYRRASNAIEATQRRHTGLARNFLGALANAQHDRRVRAALAEGFRRTRPRVASLLGLGDDQAGEDAAALVHSIFTGLLFQALLDPELAIEGRRMSRAQARLRTVLPTSS